ncbi:MAG: dihydrofolate reductase family protein [Mesorhizobium sp.]
MQELIYMFAMSLDGFIARPNGSFDWLENFPADADYDFDAFLNSIDGIVMGRGSYEAAKDRWEYSRWPTAIATSRAIDDLPDNAEAVAGTPDDLIASLRRRGANGRIWMFGGGDLARRFFDAGLLTTVEIGLIPVILGTGIPAFGGEQPDRWLKLDFARPLANGSVHLRYLAGA